MAKHPSTKAARLDHPRHRWPPLCTLTLYDGVDQRLWTSSDRDAELREPIDDLLDGVIYLNLGLSSRSKAREWELWAEAALQAVEAPIRHDIYFDGNRMRLKRDSEPGARCWQEFRWYLQVAEADADFED